MKNTLLLLAEGFEIYEASAFIDVLGWNLVDGDGTTRTTTCGLTKQVISTFGVKLTVDITAEELNVDDYDALAIPGGFSEYGFYESSYSEPFLHIIREFGSRKKTIASICTGALPIGKSGGLNGRNGTTYNQNPVRQAALASFGVKVLNLPIVEDNNIITSFNPSTALDVAFLLLEKLTNTANANRVKTLMGFGTY